MARDGRQRGRIEMVGMRVRDDHDVDVGEVRRAGQRTVSLEGPEACPQERVGQDPAVARFEQDRGVAEEAQREPRR
jgi:hypothetical protein